MAEPASFEELDRAIGAVLDAETTDFFELAEMLGLDPKRDFAGANLSDVNFSGGDLESANFVETNFKGANLTAANLRRASLANANLTDANLSFSTDLNLNFVRALTRDLSVQLDLARDLTHKLSPYLYFDLSLAIDHARDISFALRPYSDHSSTRNLYLDFSFSVSRAVDRARDLDEAITHVLAHTHTFDPAANLNTLNRAITIARVLIKTLAGADLTGADLTGAEVEGAIMVGCRGLSPSDVAELKARGAIFDEAPGDRSEVYSPVPR